MLIFPHPNMDHFWTTSRYISNLRKINCKISWKPNSQFVLRHSVHKTVELVNFMHKTWMINYWYRIVICLVYSRHALHVVYYMYCVMQYMHDRLLYYVWLLYIVAGWFLINLILFSQSMISVVLLRIHPSMFYSGNFPILSLSISLFIFYYYYSYYYICMYAHPSGSLSLLFMFIATI